MAVTENLGYPPKVHVYIYIEKKMIHKSEGTLFSDKPAAKKIHGFFRERSKKC